MSGILNSTQDVEGLQEEFYSCLCYKFKTLLTKGEYDICPVYFWEDDGLQTQATIAPPTIWLSQARDNFNEFGVVNKSSL